MVRRTEERGVSPVIAGILMLAIVVLLAAAGGALFLQVADEGTGQKPLRSAVQIHESTAGSELEVKSISQRLAVKLNGDRLMTLNQSDVGSHFLPTAPGDRVTVVVPGEGGSVVAQKNIDEENAGDYILYYDFSNGTGSKVIDRSGNTNTGQIGGDPQWVEDSVGTALKFDGQDDYVETLTLNAKAVTNVKEFTVAVKFNVTGDAAGGAGCGNCDRIQQLVEHRNDSTGFEWYLETVENSDSPYKVQYTVRPSGGLTSPNIAQQKTHVLIATYNGTAMRYYYDGTLVGVDTSPDKKVEMGELSIAADGSKEDIQYLEGKIYDLRLYYTAMDESKVQILDEQMQED